MGIIQSKLRLRHIAGKNRRKLSARSESEMAETEGFEPSVRNYPYDGLANRWFQPLTHVSAWLERSALGASGLSSVGL